MSASGWERPFESCRDFYTAVYGQHVTGIHAVGGSGITLIEAHQSAGAWSDAPVPELAIGWLPSRPVGFSCDLGAGRFSGTQRQNDAILVAPGAGSSIQMEGAHICRLLAVPYRALAELGCERGAALPANGDFGRLHAGLLRDAKLTTILDDLWSEASRGNPHGVLWADGALLQLAAVLIRLRDGSPPPPFARGGLAPWQVKRVAEYLEANLSREVSLGELAGVAHLSPAHFCRAYKESTGKTPIQQLIALRVERAKALLSEPRMPVIEVAAACGYESPSAFATTFRRAASLSPQQWRREELI